MTESAPRVSVVVPAYNNADFLAETLQSVLTQTFQDFELVVADHSSTDETWAIMQQFVHDRRVRLLRTEAGGGAVRNWNRVSQAARGEFLKLLPGDDLLHPMILEQQVAALHTDSRVVLTATTRSLIDATGGEVVAERGLGGLRGRRSGGEAIRAAVRAGTNPFGEPGCVLLRRASLEQVGWWDSRWPYFIDEATYVAVLATGDFIGLPGPLASFRLSSGQWSVRLSREQAKQAAGFHRHVHETYPDVVSRSDMRSGNARAFALAALRRVAYLYLSRRMSGATSRRA